MATIGIDLGGTKLLGAVVRDGAVETERKRPTRAGGPEAIVAEIAELVGELGGAKHVGVGAPGQVRPADGVVLGAPNLPGWDRPVPLADLLRAALPGTQVRVDNDVNVATLAEHRHGAGVDHPDVLGVFVGTGVGGGLVLHGKVRQGRSGLAGEIGHVVVRPDGRECGCGLHGHLEAYAGRGAMEAEARRRHAAGEETRLVALAGEGRMKSGVFAKALDAGDAVAVSLLDEAVEALGIGIAGAVMLLDIELVVIGGGVTEKLGDTFVGRIEEAVRSRLFASSPVRLLPAVLGDHAGVVGAAALFD